LLCWNDEVEIVQIKGNGFCIQVQVHSKKTNNLEWWIFVYMSTERSERERQWASLIADRESWGEDWVIMGDWNDIRSQKKASASWLWNSWVEVIPILAKGGSQTKIEDHSWVPQLGHQSSKPVDRASFNIIWVNELMNEQGTQWNEELVKRTFNDRESRAILAIKNLQPRMLDRWRWRLDSKGNYTVASAYSHLMKEKMIKIDAAEGSRSAELDKNVRDRSWQMRVKRKLKHFVWKSFSGILPVSCNLEKKGVSVDVICQMCGEEEETIEHLFFRCKRAKL
ncbi:RNA-directed DNA polymerase (reversetranscriptase)-related family protein, partial [Striga asiatica]